MRQVPYAIVKLARSSDRPTGADYIQNLFPDFVELHGDRRYADDPAVIGGIAMLHDLPITVIAIEKGHTAIRSEPSAILALPIRKATAKPCG